MPFVDLLAKDDRLSMWYVANTTHGIVGAFDECKPTIIMLHPLFLDSSWLGMHFEDPRLSSKYNIVAFDMRACGKSVSRASGAHDSWVDAADLAFAHQALGLPPCHVFAIENLSVNTALRFAALFPELCLSLTLVNVPPPIELQWVFDSLQDALNLWCHPQDLEEYEHACTAVIGHMLGNDVTVDLHDELTTYWSLTMPPWRRTRVYEMMHCLLNRTALPDQVLAAVTQPTLIIQSDKSDINPLKYAEKLAKDLINVPGRARVHTIKGSPEYVTLIPACASIVNRVLAEFLSRQHHVPTTFTSLTPLARRERMETALTRLGELVGNPNIASRDPRSSLSFSCVSSEVLRSQTEALRLQQEEEYLAFSPLAVDGRPLRRYSERLVDHWFSEDKDDVPTGSLMLYNKEDRLKQFDILVTRTEKAGFTSSSFSDAQHPSDAPSDGGKAVRMMRSTFTKHVVEKATVGGTGGGFAPTLIQNTLSMTKLRI